MKQLHHIVNIIPVIAKADTLTETELKKQKSRVQFSSSVCGYDNSSIVDIKRNSSQ